MSVGCSTGEEPYSIAMAIDDYMSLQRCNYYLGVTASDISRDALAIGRKGIYRSRQVKQIGKTWFDKYFTVAEDDKFQVVESLRKKGLF